MHTVTTNSLVWFRKPNGGSMVMGASSAAARLICRNATHVRALCSPRTDKRWANHGNSEC